MVGTSLSRWTPTYFGTALFWLVAAQVAMAAGYGYPHAAIEAPETLIVVHMVAIGWLSLLMCGALLQFVPVLVGTGLMGEGLAPIALFVMTLGLVMLLAGFAGLGGYVPLPDILLPTGGVLLLGGFGCVSLALARTLWAARPLSMPAWFVAVGMVCLLATAALGNAFALILAGLAGGEAAMLLLLHGVPVHAVFGLGGWLSLSAMGVGYRLFAMFLLAPDVDARSMRRVLVAGTLALALVAAAIPFAVAIGGGAGPMLGLAGLIGLAAVALFARDAVTLHRTRKRRAIELNMKGAAAAVGCLVLSSILLTGLVMTGELDARIGAAVYLFAFGWLAGLGLAKLYKIVPFLTWLECFAPSLGRASTPRVQDLVEEKSAVVWFVLYYVCVLAATAMLLTGWTIVFRLAVLIQLAATLGLIWHLYRSRALRNVPATVCGAAAPHLFFATLTTRSP